MPYLDSQWISPTGELLEAGTWVPEKNWDRWRQDGLRSPLPPSQPHRRPWNPDETVPTVPPGPTETDVRILEALPPDQQLDYLSVLGRDIGSVQRDALFYWNLLEDLKNSPSDATADDVVNKMRTLEFTSVTWPSSAGGPPAPESPLPWKKVLDWLFKQLMKAWKFLVNAVAFAAVTLHNLGMSAVAVQVWPPGVSFEFPTTLFRDPLQWGKARTFLDNLYAEWGQKVFAP